jgi:hypothetical protein
MPMYFPDLESVRKLATEMATKQEDDKKYKGIIPETEEDLPEARKQLGQYLRDVWSDKVFAMEVELALDKDNYETKMKEAIMKEIGPNFFN